MTKIYETASGKQGKSSSWKTIPGILLLQKWTIFLKNWQFMSRNQKLVLAGIVLLAAFLIFFRLTRHDILGDDGHYSFRAIGYFDYLGSLEQTTPVQWFGERPWWSLLSFHDHPPLVFLIQHIFFKLFGVSLLVSRLPAALAAVGSVLVLFFIGRKLGEINAGLFAAAALAVNSYFLWTGR